MALSLVHTANTLHITFEQPIWTTEKHTFSCHQTFYYWFKRAGKMENNKSDELRGRHSATESFFLQLSTSPETRIQLFVFQFFALSAKKKRLNSYSVEKTQSFKVHWSFSRARSARAAPREANKVSSWIWVHPRAEQVRVLRIFVFFTHSALTMIDEKLIDFSFNTLRH